MIYSTLNTTDEISVGMKLGALTWLGDIKRSVSRTNKHWYCSPSKTRNGFTAGVKLPNKHFLLKENNRPIPYKIHCTLSIRLKVVIRGHSPPDFFLCRRRPKNGNLSGSGYFCWIQNFWVQIATKTLSLQTLGEVFFKFLTPEDIFGDESERNGKLWSGNF